MRRTLPIPLVVLALSCGARSELASGSGRAEICNGEDDDGDGLVDEGIPPQRCGVGVCAREVPGCEDGKVPRCEPGAPSPEVCNGLDDDCNGTADDGLGFGPVAGPYTIWQAPVGGVALETALVPVRSGMLAIFRRGWSDGASTLLVRRLDEDGVPAAPEKILPLAVSIQGPRATPVPGGAVVAYCGRSGVADDIAMGARLDEEGGLEMGDVPIAPLGRSCGAMSPDVLWTGAAHLFGWTDNSGGPPTPTMEVLFGAHGEDLAALSGAEIDPDGDLSVAPRFAQIGGSVGAIYGLRQQPDPTISEIAFQLLSTTGELAGDRTVVGVPGGLPAQWAQVSLAADPGGFFALGANRFEPGVFRARFGADGGVVEAPAVVAGLDGMFQPMAMIARPTGGFVGAGWMSHDEGSGGRVFLLDAAGELAYLWPSPTADELAAPGLYAAPNGRVFVLYTVFSGPGYSVELREFGCTPAAAMEPPRPSPAAEDVPPPGAM